MSTLFAGPFIGEFGMELFEFQAYIRAMSRKHTRTIVSSRPAHEFLYKDFCDKYIPYEPGSVNGDGYECIHHKDVPLIHEQYSPDTLVRVLDLKSYLDLLSGKPKQFHSYKIEAQKQVDVCFCCRYFNEGADTKLERNWRYDNCIEVAKQLMAAGYTVASVGLSASCRLIPDTENFLDIDMESLASLLSGSRLVVGPSSGLMHFAALCETPLLTWGSTHLESRYRVDWNPFKSFVQYLCADDWNPSVEKLTAEILKILED
jgi:hypothetical protein